MKRDICYLCGKPGANSKDHVPPKGLLPEAQYGKYQRITLPAHRECNSAASDDEEYVRDLLIMEAEARDLPKHENLTPRVWRAWSKPAGYKRYKSIIETAVPVSLQTEARVYADMAIGVRPDIEKIKSVGRKIIRGMVFYDAEAIVNMADMPVVVLEQKDIPELRARDAAEPFWVAMSGAHCKHDTCADTVAIRRSYVGIPRNGDIFIVASFTVILWNCVMLAAVEFPLGAVEKKDFTFAIDTVNDWQSNAT